MPKYSTLVTSFFNSLNRDSMHLVSKFYCENAIFIDPVVNIKGSSSIEKYYQGLYQNVEEIKFEFSELIEQQTTVAAPWIMHLKASKLNSGKLISVPGISQIRFEESSGMAIYHRDYFDMGAFIYEHIPVLGSIIRLIKGKLH